MCHQMCSTQDSTQGTPPPEGWEGDPSNLPVAAVQSGADLPSHHSPDRSGPRNRGGTLNGQGELLVGGGKAELSPFS